MLCVSASSYRITRGANVGGRKNFGQINELNSCGSRRGEVICERLPVGYVFIPCGYPSIPVIDGILAVASRTTRAHVPEPVQVRPPAPYGATLRVVPRPATAGQPYLTFGIVALVLRQIPANSAAKGAAMGGGHFLDLDR